MSMQARKVVPIAVITVALAVGYFVGRGGDSRLGAQDLSPTRALPQQDVYYPGTEDLARDEMRVIAWTSSRTSTTASTSGSTPVSRCRVAERRNILRSDK